jgi:transcriptional regulator with XRE-family HTH domain
MSEIAVRTRRRVVVDQRELARSIGARIRAARLAAGLTQQELAGDRYTKAYISALELGHAKPSMAALDYLAPRLGTRPDRLLSDDVERWTRLEADLHLAAGRFDQALEGYHTLASREQDKTRRGELLLGVAESAVKLRRFDEAAGVLQEAHRLLAAANRTADLRRATYWQAAVHDALDDPDMARRMLLELLTDGPVEGDDPGFDVRVRIGLAQIESVHGSVERARMYLEEAGDQVATLDVRRRASYFDTLAKVRSAAGDHEAAIRAGTEALTLLREVGYEVQAASMENDMAMTLCTLGNLGRAEELARHSIATLDRLESWSDLGHALDTLATVVLERGDAAGALEQVDRSLALEADHGPADEQVGARITRAKALEALGRGDDAEAAWADAVAVARRIPSASRRRRILAARAKMLADRGRHAEAYELLAVAG